MRSETSFVTAKLSQQQNTIVVLPLQAEEKSRVVPGMQSVVLQDLYSGMAEVEMVQALMVALTKTDKFNKQSVYRSVSQAKKANLQSNMCKAHHVHSQW